jgi:LysM repeat protein
MDPQWSEIKFGPNGLTIGNYGCYICVICNLLSVAGYDITPLQLVTSLTAIGGFDENDLVIHNKVTEAFPQFSWTTALTSFEIIGGKIHGVFNHYIAKDNGTYIDSLTGESSTNIIPAGFVQENTQSVSILPPVSVPAAPVEPTPPSAPTVPEYTVKPDDTLGHIVAEHYGLISWAEIAPKVTQVAQYNGIANANDIHIGQIIKLP